MSLLIKNPHKALAISFGYKEMILDKASSKMATKENESCSCVMCGRVEKEGYVNKGKAYVFQLFGSKSNGFYGYANPHSKFVCAYCYYNYKNYKAYQNGFGDMGDILLLGDNSYKKIDCKSTSKENDIYKLFKNPPATPFAILVKEAKGNTFTDMGHCIKPTIDKDIIIVNYGEENYVCPRELTLQCVKEAVEIYARNRKKKTKKQKAVNISDDVLFNRANSLSYQNYLTSNLRNNGVFMSEYKQFMDKYSKGVRYVAKLMLESYRQDIKGEK